MSTPIDPAPSEFPQSSFPSSPSPANDPAASDGTIRLCIELARQARDFHPDRDWAAIAPLLQRIWQREPREIAWDWASALIHAAWMSPRR